MIVAAARLHITFAGMKVCTDERLPLQISPTYTLQLMDSNKAVVLKGWIYKGPLSVCVCVCVCVCTHAHQALSWQIWNEA